MISIRWIAWAAFAIILAAVLGCEEGGDSKTKTVDAPVEAGLCTSVAQLAVAAGYILSEGTGCPVDDPITAAELTVDEDDRDENYTLPWAFPFMGTAYSAIHVSTNGLVGMGMEMDADLDTFDGQPFEINISNGDWAGGFGLSDMSGIPAIVAWNIDLDSFYCGPLFGSGTCTGLRVQSKTSPDRIVIHWNTEAYDESNVGSNRINDFKAILFSTGQILLHYNTFGTVDPDTTCPGGVACTTFNGDFGSGITKSDGTNFLSLTAAAASAVWQLPGKVYLFQPQ